MLYLIMAYTFFWLVIFIYLVNLKRKIDNIEKVIEEVQKNKKNE